MPGTSAVVLCWISVSHSNSYNSSWCRSPLGKEGTLYNVNCGVCRYKWRPLACIISTISMNILLDVVQCCECDSWREDSGTGGGPSDIWLRRIEACSWTPASQWRFFISHRTSALGNTCSVQSKHSLRVSHWSRLYHCHTPTLVSQCSIWVAWWCNG